MFDLPIWTVFTVSPFSGEPSLYQPAAWHRIPGRGDLPAIEAFFKLKGCTVPAAFACLPVARDDHVGQVTAHAEVEQGRSKTPCSQARGWERARTSTAPCVRLNRRDVFTSTDER